MSRVKVELVVPDPQLDTVKIEMPKELANTLNALLWMAGAEVLYPLVDELSGALDEVLGEPSEELRDRIRKELK